MKGKALRRALASDPVRVNAPIPLIVDSTELITPEMAQEMLQRNKNNRPINWNRVEEFSEIMRRGDWKLHAQGIVLDGDGNILTGQTRLWAIVYSGVNVYFRVSKGNPKDTATVLDRGRPQSSRDLATRKTERKHSPTEASIARGVCVLRGNLRPSIDAIASVIVEKAEILACILAETRGGRKTKSLLMVLAAVCAVATDVEKVKGYMLMTDTLVDRLNEALAPHCAEQCWGRGTAFSVALQLARRIVLGKTD